MTDVFYVSSTGEMKKLGNGKYVTVQAIFFTLIFCKACYITPSFHPQPSDIVMT